MHGTNDVGMINNYTKCRSLLELHIESSKMVSWFGCRGQERSLRRYNLGRVTCE